MVAKIYALVRNSALYSLTFSLLHST